MLINKYDMSFGDSFVRFFLDADDGADAGAGGGGSPDADDAGGGGEDTFTKKQVQEEAAKAAAAERARLKKAREKHTAEMSELNQKLADLQEQLEEQRDQGVAESAADQHYAETRKLNREVETLKASLAAMTSRAEKAEQEQLATDQRQKLHDALVKAKCVDVEVGARYLGPDVHRDEDGALFIHTPTAAVPLPLDANNVGEILLERAPFLLSEHTSGGSGTAGGSPKRQGALKELEAAKEKLAQLEQEGRGGSDQAIAAYQRQKTVVRKLEAELQKAS